MKLNSVIFHTCRLNEIREFYEDKLRLSIGTYLQDGDLNKKTRSFKTSGFFIFEIV
jgi:hypothetical protein